VFATLGGSAAILLGALYALGAAIEWRRLTLADVRVADALPLVPLPHILTAGISVLLSTLLALLAVTLFLLVLRAVEELVASKRINRHLKRHTRLVKSKAVAFQYQARAETEVADRLTRIREAIDEFTPKPVSSPKTNAERQALTEYRRKVETLLSEAQQHNTERLALLDRLPRLKRDMQRYVKRLNIERRLYKAIVPLLKYGPLAFGIVIGGLVVPYPIGLGLVVAGLIWLVGTKTKTSTTTLRLALYVVVVAGVIANGILGAPSLPSAYVQTTIGPVKGRPIALTETTWYITTGGGRIQSVPVDHIRSAFTSPGAAHPVSTVLQILERAL
jgi:hypothetical protein